MIHLVLAITAENADAILDGGRPHEHRLRPPKQLPAIAHIAVTGTGTVVGECVLGEPARHSAKGWALPVARPRRYRAPRPVADYGLKKIPRSFRYCDPPEVARERRREASRAPDQASSRASTGS